MRVQRDQVQTGRKPFSSGWMWLAGVVVAGAIWGALNLRGPGSPGASSAAVFDRKALNYANQLLHLQVMLNGEGREIQPSLARLRSVFQARRAWQNAPDGVIVQEPASNTKYCFAVRHAQGSRWFLVYEDLGTAREMPDSPEMPTCQAGKE
jgi:hypothetical protein